MSRFSTKRGRPALNLPAKDRGTPELQKKRCEGKTAEPLDLYYKKGLITDAQRSAGLRLRWLYTLVFGSPGIKALKLSDEPISIRDDDPAWRAARETEYTEIMAILAKAKCKKMTLNVCVFNISCKEYAAFPLLIEGLDLICRYLKSSRK